MKSHGSDWTSQESWLGFHRSHSDRARRMQSSVLTSHRQATDSETAAGHFLYPFSQSCSLDAGRDARLRLMRMHVDFRENCWSTEVECYRRGSYNQARLLAFLCSCWSQCLHLTFCPCWSAAAAIQTPALQPASCISQAAAAPTLSSR